MSSGEGHVPSPSAPRVSVVVPTANRKARLERGLRSVLADQETFELLVVVDGNEDGTLEYLEQWAQREPRLRPMANLDARGPLGARLFGAGQARGDVVLFLDDDQVIECGMVAGHAAHHAGGDRLVVLGYTPTVLPARRSPGMSAVYVSARGYEKCCNDFESRAESVLEGAWMGNMSIRRSDLLELAIDPRRFAGLRHEDRDFGLRCLEIGMTGVFDRSLLAYHEFDRSLEAYSADAWRSGAGQALIHRLHHNLIGGLAPDFAERGIPVPARAVVRISRLRLGHTAVTAAARISIKVSGAVRLYPAEDALTRLLWRIEQQRGAREISHTPAWHLASGPPRSSGGGDGLPSSSTALRAARAPLISFVLAAWQPRQDWLESAVASVLAQQDCRLELIIVDDGSPEPVAELLPEFEADRRISLIRVPHGGEAAARNAGISAAKGDFLRFVDSDDVYPHASTARLLAAAQGEPGSVPYEATVFCDERLRPVWTMRSRRQGWVADACLLGRFPVRVPSMLFPRALVEAAGKWDLGFAGVSHDLDWLLRVLEQAPVTGSRAPATYYRKHPSGATRDFAAGERGRRLVIERFFERNPERRGTRLERQAEARFYAVEARVRLTHGLYRPMLRRLSEALLLDPASVAWELGYGAPALLGRLRSKPEPPGRLF